jgi:hypothetical protein
MVVEPSENCGDVDQTRIAMAEDLGVPTVWIVGGVRHDTRRDGIQMDIQWVDLITTSHRLRDELQLGQPIEDR